MSKHLARLQKIEDFILVSSFIIMVVASSAQVANRNVFHFGISWFEELARYAMVYMALLAAETGLRDGSQISITAITDRCPHTLKKCLQMLAKAVVIVFAAVCFLNSFTILSTQLSSGQVSPGLRVPMIIPYFALPLSFGIVSIVQTLTLICMFFDKNSPADAKEGH